MASIEKRPNGRYRVRWRPYPGAPQKARQFDRKRDAEVFRAKVKHDIDTGGYVDPDAGRISVADYFANWSASQVWRDSTRSRIEHIGRAHIIPAFGTMPLSAVKRSDVQAWVAQLSVNLAPATVTNYTNVLAMMFNAAVLDELIARTPLRKLNLPRQETTGASLVPLTTDQVRAIAEVVSPAYRAAVLAQAGLGLRFSELVGLTVDRVDFLRGHVRIDRQLARGGGVSWSAPKTAASNRLIPLAPSVRDLLAAHLANVPPDDTGLVFRNTEGNPIRPTAYAKQFERARNVLGLPGISSHDLRHYSASMLIASGCSVKAVQRFLGHATAAETLDTYGHLWPDDEDRIRDAIDAALNPIEDQLRTGTASM